MKRVILISILLFCMFAPMTASAQAPGIGSVELDCDSQTIDINVHPEQNSPVSVNCVVKNTGLLEEEISLDSDMEGNSFSLVLSETSFNLAGGEEADFVATFSASPRIPVTSEDYNISAKVVSINNIPLAQTGATTELGGEVSSLPYSRMSFEILDPSTVVISEKIDDGDGWYYVQLKLFNDGNTDDEIIVEIMNVDELYELGVTHSFASMNPFYFGIDNYKETVSPGVTSNAGIMSIGVETIPDEDVSFEIELRAYSLTDSSSEFYDITIDVEITGSETSGGALGLDAVSSSDLKLVGMAGGGLIGVIVLLVLISRLTKKTAGKQKVAAKEAKKAAKAQRRGRSPKKAKKTKVVEEEYEDDDDFDFDDFDDDFDFDGL